MFGTLGLPELILIFIVALLLFGPDKLPEVAKTIAKTIKDFRKEMAGVRKTIEDEIGDITGDLDDINKDIIIAGDLIEDNEKKENTANNEEDKDKKDTEKVIKGKETDAGNKGTEKR